MKQKKHYIDINALAFIINFNVVVDFIINLKCGNLNSISYNRVMNL